MQTDVTDRIEAVLDPLREHPPAGMIEVPIRLKNASRHPIHGPLTVEVTRLAPDGTILDSQNGKSGVGAQLDYSHALGDFESLEPDAISEGVVWRFRAPADASGLPSFRFQVTGRVERVK